ncbi:MAG: TIGR01777 family oxidoreductase [Caulobacterales bacterium]
MTLVLILLSAQALLGALDNLLHHEIVAALPSRPGARLELALHTAREAIYAVLFIGLGWFEWRGAFALLLAGLMLVEIVITLKDFLVEDETRRLPPFERVLHTVLALGFGAVLAVFAPVLIAWAASPTGLATTQHGVLSWVMTAFSLGVAAWAVRDGLAVRDLGRRVDAISVSPRDGAVLVTGATGFVGRAVTAALIAQRRRVFVLTRDRLAARAQFGDAVQAVEQLDELPDELRLEAIVNLAGAGVAGGLWTAARRRTLLDSRVRTTEALAALIARLEHRPAVLVNASAVGFYGDAGETLVDETAPVGAGFMAELCAAWEASVGGAGALGVRTVVLRLGLVFHWSGGILPMLALPARFGAAARMGSGDQWAPWIHRDDVVRLVLTAIDDPAWRGTINAVAPDLMTQAQFTRRLSVFLRRPQWAAVPAWPVRMLLGEMSDLFLAGQRVLPRRLFELGFVFSRPTLESALAPARGPLRFGAAPCAVEPPTPVLPRSAASAPVSGSRSPRTAALPPLSPRTTASTAPAKRFARG